jgi:hypothetical protein
VALFAVAALFSSAWSRVPLAVAATKTVTTLVGFLPPPYAGGQTLAATGSFLGGGAPVAVAAPAKKVGKAAPIPAATPSRAAFTAAIVKPPSAKPKLVRAVCKGSSCDGAAKRVTRAPKAGAKIEVITLYPIEPVKFAFAAGTGDVVADSSGTCEGIDVKALAKEANVAFYVADLDQLCEIRSRDGATFVRVHRQSFPDWVGLQPNDYWRDYGTGLGRSSLTHVSSGKQDFSGVNVFLDGGRLIEAFSLNGGLDRAKQVAGIVIPQVTKPDPVTQSSGRCGPIDAKALAGLLQKSVVQVSGEEALRGEYCRLTVNNYEANIMVGTVAVTDEDGLEPNEFFPEKEAGLGRVAVYRPPQGELAPLQPNYHTFQVLKDPLNVVVYIAAPSRDEAKAFVSRVLAAPLS